MTPQEALTMLGNFSYKKIGDLYVGLKYGDRVQETFTTTGTGTISLGGAIVGYQAFSAILSNTDTCYYTATDGTNWEVGLGTYATAGNTLARTTVQASSNGGSAVSWAAGTKSICGLISQRRHLRLLQDYLSA